jgi:hypothetical protein
MTLQEALRADTCTFPSKTISLQNRCADRIDSLESRALEAEDIAAEYEAELARVWGINEKLLRIVPNDPQAVELCQGAFHSTEGQ